MNPISPTRSHCFDSVQKEYPKRSKDRLGYFLLTMDHRSYFFE
jgi:hypothetical protein